ncbi:MAG TPA: CSLREA domain-containing protein [Thermoanaerobaculia bacterium]|nr:CSLREA domain-containing protein [Thermoanaerobaculia bacterium]
MIRSALLAASLILLSAPDLHATVFTVNSNADTDDGVCNAANCTLREAINAANANAGADTIRFAIGSGTKSIALLSPLPTIVDPVTIDGTTQPGYAGTPIIELNGASAGTGANGLHITAGSSVVTGLVINRFVPGFPNLGGNGIFLDGGGGNVVRGCYVGINVAGTAALGNGGSGILISSSPNNVIGRTDTSQRVNVVSGNGRHGVEIAGGGSDANVVAGGRFGTNAAGTAALGNGSVGVEISSGAGNVVGSDLPGDTVLSGNVGDGVSVSAPATDTLVKNCWVGLNAGGSAALANGGQGIDLGGVTSGTIGPGNVVSGNTQSGILLISGVSGVTVTGNFAGTNPAGTAAIPNAANGIIVSNASNNVIGPSNLASGNGTNGIRVRTGASGNVVKGNLVGVNAAMTAALANGAEGVQVNDGATGNTIGGPGSDRNVIAGNANNGVLLADAATTGNVVAGNFIGTDATASLAIANAANGVDVQNGASGNTIGGTEPGTQNVIAFNGGRGVFVESGAGNAILGNAIAGNGGLGIDLAPLGVTPNDLGDPDVGPNLLQNFPVVTAVLLSPGTTEIDGTLNSLSSLGFRVELFAALACDPAGNGPGQRPLGSVDATTDAAGNASFSAMLGPALGPWITATATDPSGNTSEFSACFATPPPAASGMSPGSGPAAGNTPVVVLGTNFQAPAAVHFGSVAGSMVSVVNGGEVDAVSPMLPPGALYNVAVVNPSTLSATLPAAWFADFTDVPAANPFHDDVEKIFRAAITAGCGGGNYCPSSSVTRAQMAVFLLRAEHGSSYAPPACAGIFTDVSCPSQYADWIERLSAEGVTAGCGGGDYCPNAAVTRQQMAVFLLKTEHGPAYVPPTCTGVFEDVTCPSQYADWIEELSTEAITGGCQTSPLLYCPTSPVNRGQMAVFLVKTFSLP